MFLARKNEFQGRVNMSVSEPPAMGSGRAVRRSAAHCTKENSMDTQQTTRSDPNGPTDFGHSNGSVGAPPQGAAQRIG